VPVGVVLAVPGDVGLPRRLLLAVSPAVLSLLALFLAAVDVWTDVSALQLGWLQGVAARVETGAGRLGGHGGGARPTRRFRLGGRPKSLAHMSRGFRTMLRLPWTPPLRSSTV